MSFLEKLKFLGQFGDELVALLGLLAEFQSATTLEAKAQIVVRGATMIAAKTPTNIDDLAAELAQVFFDSPKVVDAAKRLVDAIIAASKS